MSKQIRVPDKKAWLESWYCDDPRYKDLFVVEDPDLPPNTFAVDDE